LRYVFKLLKIKTKYKNPSHVGLEIKTKNENPTYLALFLNPLSENQNIFLDGLIYQIYEY
jgi:nitrate reductase assembly molybdenum cofactor insertion protein NarJ